MIWDVLITLFAVALAINGWNRGILRSWRGPIAMVAATLMVKHVYIDFASLIVSHLHLSPENGVFISYMMLWLSGETVIELLLTLLVKDFIKAQPIFLDRLSGAFYGLTKAATVVVLPLMAVSVEINIPPAPPDKSGLVVQIDSSVGNSYLVERLASVSKSLIHGLGNYVVSTNAPSFTPNYDVKPDDETTEEQNTRVQKAKQTIESLLK